MRVVEELVQQREQLLVHAAARDYHLQQTAFVDGLIRDAIAAVGSQSFAVLATGGYGRSELAPYSDADLVVVPSPDQAEESDAAIKAFDRLLVDRFARPLSIPFVVRYLPLEDLPGLDQNSRTSLIDARPIAGPTALSQALLDDLWNTTSTGEFLQEKLAERRSERQLHGETWAVTEPNLKHGSGGLRDLHAADWIRWTIGLRRIDRPAGYDVLLQTRSMLHAVSGKLDDRLTRSKQEAIKNRFHIDPESWIANLWQAMEEADACFMAAERDVRESRFVVSPGVIAIRGEARILATADLGQAAMGCELADEVGLEVHPTDLHLPLTRPALAFDAIARRGRSARVLDYAGLLTNLLPELAECRYLVSRDSVHQYSVFEHSLRTMELIDAPAPGFIEEARSLLSDLRPVRFAALVHDIGKANRDVSHAEAGETIVRALLRNRFELDSDQIETVAWLVREHLTYSKFIRLRDVYSAEVVEEFVQVVGTRERLAQLALLTWADISAVSDQAWTPAQEALMDVLYRAASDRFDPILAASRSARRKPVQVDEGELAAFYDRLPAAYTVRNLPDQAAVHLALAKLASAGESSVQIERKPELGWSEMLVITPDRPGLLSAILGVIYAHGYGLINLRAATTVEAHPIAIDEITVTHQHRAPIPEELKEGLRKDMLAAFENTQVIDDLLRRKGKDPLQRQQILSWRYHHGDHPRIELRAPRGKGLAYRVARMLSAEGIGIQSAHVGLYAGAGAASFTLTEGATREALERVLGPAS